MSFIETRLSDRVALGFQVIPTYSTRIVPLDNGRESRNVNWTKAKRRFSALYQNFTPEQFADLLDCFHAVQGSAYSFRFKDWSDYQVVNGSLGAAPAGSDPIQLVKVYTFGAQTVTRIITKPVVGTLVVSQGGALVPGTLDETTGEFTPSGAWGVGEVFATFQFDVPVRFASDEMPSAWENRQAITTTAELVEDFL
jgi:uncharacterized protein (TIGR02217 family)